MLPTPLHLQGDVYRIFFSGRDKEGHSHIGYVDIDLEKPTEILNISEKPVLSPGLLGTFDDSGVSPLCTLRRGEMILLYYMGWHRDGTTRVSEMTGHAFGDMSHFERLSLVPVLERNHYEPYSIRVLSCVIEEGNLWRGYYDGCDIWLSPQLPKYTIKYCEGDPGGSWDGCRNIVSVPYLYPNETRISRASVIKEKDYYRMWYCYAIGDGGYRMGYGESEEGIKFTRMDDKAGIDMSADGWDSEMVCYPSVFRHKGQLWMLYCGNGYGRTGFGIAREE